MGVRRRRVALVRAGVRVGPEAGGRVLPLHADDVHLRQQPGPAQASRHMAGVSAHELGAPFRWHMSIGKLNKAIADVVDAFIELDLVRAWGDGATVAAAGTQVETFIDNLLAETSIRHGEPAGSRTTTSPTPTSRCSPSSSRAGYGRRCTSPKA
jgi:hypothetical protein